MTSPACVIGRSSSDALRKRPEPDNVFAGQAILHVNVKPVRLKPGTVVPFPLTLTENSED